MKKIMFPMSFLAAVLFLPSTLVLGCEEGPKTALCSVSLAGTGESRTVLPPGIACANYGFEGRGPGGLIVTKTAVSGPAVFEVEPGAWVFIVTGYNSDALPVAIGQGSTDLEPGDKKSLLITLYPVEGEGVLRIEASVPPTADPACRFSGELKPETGAEAVAIDEAAGTKTLQFGALASGYWIVSLSLKKGQILYSGIAETVRIASGQTTVLSADFGYENASASVSFMEDLKTPLEPEISPPALAIGKGFPALFRAGEVSGLGNGSLRWFLNGVQSAEGEACTVATGTLPSRVRLDLLARSESGDRSGSSSAFLEVLPAVDLGLFKVYERITRPLADGSGLVPSGFADPRALVEIPSRRLIVQAGGGDSGLAVFARSEDGQYEYLESVRNRTGLGLDAPSGLAASPDGTYFVAACSSSDSLLVFGFDSSGHPVRIASYKNDVGGITGIDAPRSPVFSADGGFLYCAGNASDTVAVFSFDSGTGTLAQLECLTATGELEGLLLAPSRTAISPDGSLLAVSCQSSDALVFFSRSSIDGKLAFLSGFKNGVNGASGLDGIEGLSFSPDGAHLYAAANYDDAIAHFSISGSSVSFVGAYFNGEGTISDLDCPRRCAVSPDGLYFACVAANSSSVSLFRRDQATGTLTAAGKILDGISGAEGFGKPQEIIFANGGSDILVSSATDLALSILREYP